MSCTPNVGCCMRLWSSVLRPMTCCTTQRSHERRTVLTSLSGGNTQVLSSPFSRLWFWFRSLSLSGEAITHAFAAKWVYPELQGHFVPLLLKWNMSSPLKWATLEDGDSVQIKESTTSMGASLPFSYPAHTKFQSIPSLIAVLIEWAFVSTQTAWRRTIRQAKDIISPSDNPATNAPETVTQLFEKLTRILQKYLDCACTTHLSPRGRHISDVNYTIRRRKVVWTQLFPCTL